MMMRAVRVPSYPPGDGGDGCECMNRKQFRCTLTATMLIVITSMFVVYFLLKNDGSEGFELTILHTNDIHARLEQFDKNLGKCEGEGKGCFGGVARMYTAIQNLRKEKKHVLLLDGGDQFAGTMWFEQYKGLASATFMNMMRYDAMTLGNHEFDLGPKALHPFIKKLRFPVVTTNIDFTRQPNWPKEEKFHLKSTIVKFKNTSVAIIGFVTPETTWLSSPGPNITFTSIIPAIRKEVNKLKHLGVTIFIGLGHAGFRVDVEVLRNIPELDIVVGGHSNTFLYTGTPPSSDQPKGPYPYVVTDNSKNQLAVQAYALGKYLGFLTVRFDETGKVKTWNGNPVLLDSTIKRDKKMLEKLNRMSILVKSRSNEVIGYTTAPLRRAPCRIGDCSLGNMIADAIAAMTKTDLVLFNSGGIRASIVKRDAEDGITYGELYNVHPFGNAMDIITLRGSVLKEVFEHSVSGLPERTLGRFLQVSGLRVHYDISKAVGKRVVKVKTRIISNNSSLYKEVDDTKLYTVAVSDYLIGGGDGFSMLKNHESRQSGEKIISLVKKFMSANSPLSPKTDGRIVVIGRNGSK